MLNIRQIETKIVNSWVWFHIYYKHTKKHKSDLNRVRAKVMKVRNRALNRNDK